MYNIYTVADLPRQNRDTECQKNGFQGPARIPLFPSPPKIASAPDWWIRSGDLLLARNTWWLGGRPLWPCRKINCLCHWEGEGSADGELDRHNSFRF